MTPVYSQSTPWKSEVPGWQEELRKTELELEENCPPEEEGKAPQGETGSSTTHTRAPLGNEKTGMKALKQGQALGKLQMKRYKGRGLVGGRL